MRTGFEEDVDLFRSRFGDGIFEFRFFTIGEVHYHAQVEVVGVGKVHAFAETVRPKIGQFEFFRDGEQHGFPLQCHFLPIHLHRTRERGDEGLAHALHFESDARVRTAELPAFEVGDIGEDVIGIHAGFADKDIAGNEERKFFNITQDLDPGMSAGQGVHRRTHIHEGGFDRVGIHVACGGDDLLINIRSERIPVAFGGIALIFGQVHEDGGLFVFDVVADDAQAERSERAGVCLAEHERTFGFCTGKIVSACPNLTTAPVEVANQQGEVVPRDHVVIPVGVLADTAMNIDTGVLTVRGELERQFFDILGAHPGDLCPFFNGLGIGRFIQDLHTAFDGELANFGIHQKLTSGYGIFCIVRIEQHRIGIRIEHDEGVCGVHNRLCPI